MNIQILTPQKCLIVQLLWLGLYNAVQSAVPIKGSSSGSHRCTNNENSAIKKVINAFTHNKCRRFEKAAKEIGVFPLLVESEVNGKHFDYRLYGEACDPKVEEQYWETVSAIVLYKEVNDPTNTGKINITTSESNVVKHWGKVWLDRDDKFSPHVCNFKKLLECDIESKTCFCRTTGISHINVDRQYHIAYRKAQDGSFSTIYEISNSCAAKDHLESCDWNIPYIGQCHVPCFVNSTCSEYDPNEDGSAPLFDEAAKLGRRRCIDQSVIASLSNPKKNGAVHLLVSQTQIIWFATCIIIPVQIVLSMATVVTYSKLIITTWHSN